MNCDIVYIVDHNDNDIVDLIESTGNTVLAAYHPNYLIAQHQGYKARGDLAITMLSKGVSAAILDVTNNKCRHAYFSDAKRNRTANFSGASGPMQGAKSFVPKYWANWMNGE